MTTNDRETKRRLRRGDRVRIRTAEQILATLDAAAALDGLPFMPEMARFCGQVARVDRVAHKTCDTIDQTGGRAMADAVHLEGLRCDGAGHGGCDANCLIFWKTAWLEPIGDDASDRETDATSLEVLASRHAAGKNAVGTTVYRCQTTELKQATQPLAWWNPAQYLRDVTSGNYRAAHVAWVLTGALLRWLMSIGIGFRFWKRLYGAYQRRVGADPWPHAVGTLPDGAATPVQKLDLEAGEWVRIRPKEEILATMTRKNRNRGLFFDVEMVPYCGGKYRVLKRVEKIINEKTGEMLPMKTPCIMLDGVVCQSIYSQCRLMCPRAIPSYWREIWLERVGENADAATDPAS